MTKLFCVDTPERLREMTQFVKEGNVSSVATVWNASRRKGNDKWDGKIMVSFFTEGRKRNAVIMRLNSEIKEFATLKYTAALKWCSEKLKMVDMVLLP